MNFEVSWAELSDRSVFTLDNGAEVRTVTIPAIGKVLFDKDADNFIDAINALWARGEEQE